MKRTRHLLRNFPLVRTSNVEELEHTLGRMISRPVVELVGCNNTLDAVQNYFKLRHVGINYGTYGTGIRFKFSETAIVGQVFPLAGSAEVQVGGKTIVADVDHSVVVSPDDKFTMTSSADYERLNLCIDPAALTGLVSALTGETTDSALKIDPMPNLTPSTRGLREHLFFLTRQICTTSVLPPLLLAEFEQTILVTFLHANRHNYSHLLEREPAGAAPWQVRYAEEYIEANWNDPMCFEAIAAAVGVGVRSLFATYQQSRGCSPVAFLRRTRLRHARRMLQHPESTTSVESVAFACGFGNIGRFESDYLRAFGQHPSQTLARGRGGTITWH